MRCRVRRLNECHNAREFEQCATICSVVLSTRLISVSSCAKVSSLCRPVHTIGGDRLESLLHGHYCWMMSIHIYIHTYTLGQTTPSLTLGVVHTYQRVAMCVYFVRVLPCARFYQCCFIAQVLYQRVAVRAAVCTHFISGS